MLGSEKSALCSSAIYEQNVSISLHLSDSVPRHEKLLYSSIDTIFQLSNMLGC